MKRRFSQKELYEIRNLIPINDLIRELDIPNKISEGYFRFLCPLCGEFMTSTKADTNLARCFRCEENFNTIDLAKICRRASFVEAVTFLKAFYRHIQINKQRLADLPGILERSVKGVE